MVFYLSVFRQSLILQLATLLFTRDRRIIPWHLSQAENTLSQIRIPPLALSSGCCDAVAYVERLDRIYHEPIQLQPEHRRERSPLSTALRAWRTSRAKADAVAPFIVFHDATIEAIAERRPRSIAELRRVPGVGPTKLDRYGEEILAVVVAQD